jgi:2-iminobutanoate/2-iminopropanoate deaminase
MNLRAVNPPGIGLFGIGGRPAPYSNGMLAQGEYELLFVSGQVAFDQNGEIVGTDIDTQADRALRNLLVVLAEAGGGPEHVIKFNAFLTRREYVAAYVAARDRLFPGCRPASSTVICELVSPDMLIEVEAVAALPAGAAR